MKKLLILSVVIIGSVFVYNDSKAQASWEVGARFGTRGSVEATIPVGIAPRIQPAVYFYGTDGLPNDFGIAGYFDWMFKLSDGPSGLKFFPGVGPEFYFDNQFNFSIAGNFGVEYAFEIPLTIAFDWRPAIFMTNSHGFEAANVGFSARFRFGESVKFEKTD
jgi:hypothetical protein